MAFLLAVSSIVSFEPCHSIRQNEIVSLKGAGSNNAMIYIGCSRTGVLSHGSNAVVFIMITSGRAQS